jgi:uncharacterized RDD family membrane protein YckC
MAGGAHADPQSVDAGGKVAEDLERRLAGLGVVIAPWPRRVAAWLLDVALFVIPAAAVIYLTGGFALVLRLVEETIGKELGLLGQGASAPPATDLVGAHTAVVKLIALLAVVVVFGAGWVATRIGATSRFGRTPGKWCLRLRVVDVARPPAPPRLTKAALRWLVSQISGAVPLPGTGMLVYSPALRDPWGRGLHDRAAGTVVVHEAAHQPDRRRRRHGCSRQRRV